MAGRGGAKPPRWEAAPAWGPGAGGGQTRTRVVWGCGGLLLGIVLAVFGLVFLAPHPQIVTPAPATETSITITFDDRYLTRLVSEGIARAGLPFTIGDVHAHIAPDNLIFISGSAQLGTQTSIAELTAQAQVTAVGGTIALRNLYGTVGGLVLSGSAAGVLETAINVRIATERHLLTQGGIQYAVVGVSSTEGHLTLQLTFA